MTYSAGLLLIRFTPQGPQFLLGHPGEPLWAHRDRGAWSIPKGMIRRGERPVDAAVREFREETGFEPCGAPIALHPVQTGPRKLLLPFLMHGDADPKDLASRTVRLVWPRTSGRVLCFPEFDRVAWFGPEEALVRILHGQAEVIAAALAEGRRHAGLAGSNMAVSAGATPDAVGANE